MNTASAISVLAWLHNPYILTILFSLQFIESFKEGLVILIRRIHMLDVKSKRDSQFERVLVTVMIVLLNISEKGLLIAKMIVALKPVI